MGATTRHEARGKLGGGGGTPHHGRPMEGCNGGPKGVEGPRGGRAVTLVGEIGKHVKLKI